jgi:hypothetical protein
MGLNFGRREWRNYPAMARRWSRVPAASPAHDRDYLYTLTVRAARASWIGQWI